MSRIVQIVNGLNTYHGRDACIKFLQYFMLFVYGSILTLDYQNYFKIAKSFSNLSKQSSNCRIILRFFEDLPAIINLLNYFNAKENNSNLRTIKLVNLTFWISYNIFEHIAWLSEFGFIELDYKLWWTYTFSSWCGGLLTSIILSFRVIYLYFVNQEKEKKGSEKKKLAKIKREDFNNSVLFALRDFSDLLIAVNYLPKGILWATTIAHYQIGLLGTFSASCRIYTFVWKSKLQ